jgi:hypothetical protein
LTGVTRFTPFKSPGSEVGSSDCVGCVGFWVAVPVLYIGVPEGRDAGDGGGLNMFTLLVSTKASCGPERVHPVQRTPFYIWRQTLLKAKSLIRTFWLLRRQHHTKQTVNGAG